MGKLTVFFIILFLAIVGILAFYNQGSVEIRLWKDITYNVPIIGLIMFSAAFGIISMSIIIAIRDIKRYLESWKIQRRQKKEQKIRDTFMRAMDAYYVSRLEDATELFTKVLEDAPDHFEALMRLGDIHRRNRDLRSAEELYLRAKEVRPKSMEVMISLIEIAEESKKWQEALKYLDEILSVDGDNIMALKKKRKIYEGLGKWDEAIEVQNKLLKCKLPDEEEAEENRILQCYKYESAKKLIKDGEPERGIKILKGLLKSNEGFVPAYITLSDAYTKSNNTRDAESILLKGYETTSSLVILSRLEEYYISQGEPGKIIDLYQKAIQNDRNDWRLHYLLAKLYYRLEMIDYAYEKVNEIDMSSFNLPGLHALYGCILERRAEHDKALAEIKKAINIEDIIKVPYCCGSCKFTSDEYTDRCPKCGKWDTFLLDVNEICQKKEG